MINWSGSKNDKRIRGYDLQRKIIERTSYTQPGATMAVGGGLRTEHKCLKWVRNKAKNDFRLSWGR